MWNAQKKLEKIYRASSSVHPSELDNPSTPPQNNPENLNKVKIDRLEIVTGREFIKEYDFLTDPESSSVAVNAVKIVFDENDPFFKSLEQFLILTYKERWTYSTATQVLSQSSDPPFNTIILNGRLNLFVENFLEGLMGDDLKYSPWNTPLQNVNIMLTHFSNKFELILFSTEYINFQLFVKQYNESTWPNGKEKITDVMVSPPIAYESPATEHGITHILSAPLIEQSQEGQIGLTKEEFRNHKPQITSRGQNLFHYKSTGLRTNVNEILKIFPIVWEPNINNTFRIYTGYKKRQNDVYPQDTIDDISNIPRRFYISYVRPKAITYPGRDREVMMEIKLIPKSNDYNMTLEAYLVIS